MNWYKISLGIRSNDIHEYIEHAETVCYKYPQKWGDCHKINSTVAAWLNEKTGSSRFKAIQIKAFLEGEVDDDGKMTDSPHHVVVYDTETKEIKDYSMTLDYPMVDWEYLGDLSRDVDNNLLRLLRE